MNVGARLRKRASYVDTVFWSRIQVERDIGCEGRVVYKHTIGGATCWGARGIRMPHVRSMIELTGPSIHSSSVYSVG